MAGSRSGLPKVRWYGEGKVVMGGGWMHVGYFLYRTAG